MKNSILEKFSKEDKTLESSLGTIVSDLYFSLNLGVEYEKSINKGVLSKEESFMVITMIQKASKIKGKNKHTEEEKRLMKIGKLAEDIIIIANEGLIRSTIQRVLKTKSFDKDFIQEGRMGLLAAAKRFDINFGNEFSTYATWWIRQRIISHIIRLKPFKTPHNISTTANKVKNIVIKHDINIDPISKEDLHKLSLITKLEKEELEKLLNIVLLEDIKSLDRKLEDGNSVGDFLANTESKEHSNFEHKEANTFVRKVLTDDFLKSSNSKLQIYGVIIILRSGISQLYPEVIKILTNLESKKQTSLVHNISKKAFKKLEEQRDEIKEVLYKISNNQKLSEEKRQFASKIYQDLCNKKISIKKEISKGNEELTVLITTAYLLATKPNKTSIKKIETEIFNILSGGNNIFERYYILIQKSVKLHLENQSKKQISIGETEDVIKSFIDIHKKDYLKLQDIGAILNVSRERIRQIEKEAMKILKIKIIN